MSKEILASSEIKKQLVVDFKTSSVSVWKALTFKTESRFANMIRKAALERGGRFSDGTPSLESWSPNCETTFQTASSTMTQVFSDRVKIVADFKNDKVAVLIDGNPKVSGILSEMSIPEFMKLQKNAQEAAGQLK